MRISGGYVYIVRVCNVYKIGVSVLPEQRVSLIRTDNYKPMQIIGFWQFREPYEIEEELHDIYINKRVRGEWFKLTKAEIDKIVYVLDKCVEDGL